MVIYYQAIISGKLSDFFTERPINLKWKSSNDIGKETGSGFRGSSFTANLLAVTWYFKFEINDYLKFNATSQYESCVKF